MVTEEHSASLAWLGNDNKRVPTKKRCSVPRKNSHLVGPTRPRGATVDIFNMFHSRFYGYCCSE